MELLHREGGLVGLDSDGISVVARELRLDAFSLHMSVMND